MNTIPLVMFLLAGILLCAGCAGPAPSTPLVPPVTTPVATPMPDTPIPTPLSTLTPPPTPSWVPTQTFTPTPPPPGQLTPVTTPRIAVEPPFLEYLDFQKNTFIYPVPSCIMQTAFPAIAGDSGYGIRQEVPRLVLLSDDDYATFIRKYTQGNSANTPFITPAACTGTSNEPTWNFVMVRIVLNPTNSVAADYAVSRNVWSDKKLVGVLTTSENLVMDKKASLIGYIPLKTSEMDRFDSITVTTVRA